MIVEVEFRGVELTDGTARCGETISGVSMARVVTRSGHRWILHVQREDEVITYPVARVSAFWITHEPGERLTVTAWPTGTENVRHEVTVSRVERVSWLFMDDQVEVTADRGSWTHLLSGLRGLTASVE